MSDLAEFLTARLDEDEAVAKRAAGADAVQKAGHAPGDWSWLGSFGQPNPGDYALIDYQVRFDPVRVLREVEAGRHILARYEDCLVRQDDGSYPTATAREQAREYEDFVLPSLTAKYSGHPDYEEDWKP